MDMKADAKQPPASQRASRGARGGYVLPAPPRGSRDQLVVEPLEASPPAGLAEAGVEAVGRRCLLQAETLGDLLGELREQLGSVSAGVAADSRAPLEAAVQRLSDVLGWCEAVQEDLERDARKARAGRAPLELSALCEQVACVAGARGPVTVDAKGSSMVWGLRSEVCRLLELALDVVWMRAGGRGLRTVSIQQERDEVQVRIRSAAEPRGELDPERIDAFRNAAARTGVRVAPDALGKGVAGLVLRFPSV